MEWEANLDGGAPRHDVTVASRRDRSDVSYERPLEVTREHRSPFPPA